MARAEDVFNEDFLTESMKNKGFTPPPADVKRFSTVVTHRVFRLWAAGEENTTNDEYVALLSKFVNEPDKYQITSMREYQMDSAIVISVCWNEIQPIVDEKHV